MVSEDQLNHLDLIAEVMLYDEDDPRSSHYRRVLKRPKINWLKIVLICALVLLGTVSVYAALVYFQVTHGLALAISICCLVLVCLLCLKRITICLIKIYQRYAPASIRNKCRFEPSCSEYFMLSLQKYGLIKGMRKGVNRLTRCNVDNGGFDEP